ncbi:polyphosphate kinase 1 [Armatimonas rosea]|uniref:Polyphosphate kinase n=1 Tax=Armatimonas rosea TaxID=685828 RepID=A0A7W9SND2_ARMRO|nr:polyphosphate kinase 1 [Armatimonas rosea]MBB6049796.1 polyphosphate kinase [Armatimonas rosea]
MSAETETLTPERMPYINRELSWLSFNSRVLEEAWDETNPLLERVKFLAIFGNNLDEFFMIRVSGLQAQRTAQVADVAADGLTPTEALDQIGVEVARLSALAQDCWKELRRLLKRQRIEVVTYEELTADERTNLARFFEAEVFPTLTPLAVDHGHPFPHISNLSLNLAIVVNDPIRGQRFARMKIPATFPRLVPTGTTTRFVWIEEVIAHHVGALFPGLDVNHRAVYPFRVTRDADIEIQEDETEDLLRSVEADINKRHFGFVTRLEVTEAMPTTIRNLVIEGLEMDPRNLVATGASLGGELGYSSLMELMKVDRPDLKDKPYVPRLPATLSTGQDIFGAIASNDILLHHPYDSFAPVLALVEAAARDQNVLAIKQTLYRVGANSPLVPALVTARDVDTQVAVLVELKARFDEQNNIAWARQLEQAGVHVVYGLMGLKTHSKCLLIVRKEADGIKRYVHLGTGNYNATTARFYTDLGLLTCDPELGADVTDLFNYLTGYSRQTKFRKLLVAPINLRQEMARRIQREAEHAKAGRPARLIFQMNALVDPEMIELLYAASGAGVRVELIIRGICCLLPGLPGWSENIRVVSIVGRFLEHARIFYFENGGEPELYAGSADLMQRNLDRRVEVVFPIENPKLKAHVVNKVLATLLADNVQARELKPDGSYERLKPKDRKRRDAQMLFQRTGQRR